MNSKVVTAILFTVALLIVLPVLSTVNATPGGNSALVADGTPAPPPVPNPYLLPELVADGTPAPPPVPNPYLLPELVADGTPAPPPVPNPYLVPQSEQIAA